MVGPHQQPKFTQALTNLVIPLPPTEICFGPRAYVSVCKVSLPLYLAVNVYSILSSQ